MKNALKKEIKYFLSNYYWLLIITLFIYMGYLIINEHINYLEFARQQLLFQYESTGDINYLHLANSKSFINIYIVMSGFYNDFINGTNGVMFISVILSIIILSNTSLSYYIYERQGYIKYEYLQISKREFFLSKILVNTIGIGIIFIIPQLLLLIYYSFFYSNSLSLVNYQFCRTEFTGWCKSIIVDKVFNFNYPITTILLNNLLRPFLTGILLSLTVLTFSFIAKRKSLLIVFSLGFMFLYIALFSIKQTLIMTFTNASFDDVFSKTFIPYVGLFSKNNISDFSSYLISVSINIFILFVIIILIWRKVKDEI